MAGTGNGSFRFASFWTPVWIVVIAAIAVAGVLYYPDPDFADFMRIVTIYGIVSGAMLALLLWFLFSGAFSWTGRILGMIGLGVLAGVSSQLVEFRKFSGNLKPEIRFIWDKSQAEIVRESRAAAGKAESPAGTFRGDEEGSFSQYRGDRNEGVVRGIRLEKDWRQRPPRLLWKQPCGGGYAQIVVAGDVAVTIEQRGANEAVVCYDAVTGKERWVHEYPGHFREVMGGEGPRATPTLRDNRVYSIGALGRLVCLDGADGRLIWSADALEKSGSNIAWGVSCSPIIHGNLVIVQSGVNKNGTPGNAVLAFDRASGKQIWAMGNSYGSYSTPKISTVCGVETMAVFDGDGLTLYDLAALKPVAAFPWVTEQKIHVAQPLVLDDDRIFITSGYGTGCAMLKAQKNGDQWALEPLWRNKYLRCRFTSPVYRDGFIYGLDEGIMVCIDAANGKRKWKAGRYGNGQILLVDDVIVIQMESGRVALVEANPSSHKELAQADGVDGNTWNCPAIANGRLFIRNHLEMACFELPLVNGHSNPVAGR